MTTKLKGVCHNFGFKPFGAVNRAVVVGPGVTGSFPTNGTSLNLGLDWRIKLRVRRATAASSYVTQYMQGAGDGFGIIHGFGGDVYELYCPNSAAGNVRAALVSTVPDYGFHDVEFAYSGTTTSGTLNGFFDGVLEVSLSMANFAPPVVANVAFELASRPSNNPFNGAISSLLLMAGSTALVDLTFDEESGNALNAGSLGGEMIFTGGGTREIA